MRRHQFLVAVALALPAHAEPAATDLATISEQSGTVSHGVVTVGAPTASVYALITDYANWRKFLSDIEMVKVESGGRRDAQVRMKSRALGEEVTVAFDNETDRAIHFKLVDGPPGARARGDYQLIAIDGGGRTRIDATLYMDVVGVTGLFISDRKIRSMRQGKLRADLEDVARWIRLQQRAAAR